MARRRHRAGLLWTWTLILVLASMPSAAGDEQAGVLAASVGTQVVLADPDGRWHKALPAGTVAWLYPAPGGSLFAPDLVRGRTSVIDLGSLQVAEVLEGVSMPRFAEAEHRYLVTAPGEVLVSSYPDRALIKRLEVEVTSPWQAVIARDGSTLLILDRRPDGTGEAHLVAVDMVAGRQVYRRGLGGDSRALALGLGGLVAEVASDRSTVRLIDPSTLLVVLELPLAGPGTAVAFADDGERLLTTAVADSGGELLSWRLKPEDGGLKVRDERRLVLEAAPVRMAVSPTGERVAVALASGAIQVYQVRKLRLEAGHELPAAPRDLVWCDLTAVGPLTPQWSDDKPPELSIGRVPSGDGP